MWPEREVLTKDEDSFFCTTVNKEIQKQQQRKRCHGPITSVELDLEGYLTPDSCPSYRLPEQDKDRDSTSWLSAPYRGVSREGYGAGWHEGLTCPLAGRIPSTHPGRPPKRWLPTDKAWHSNCKPSRLAGWRKERGEEKLVSLLVRKRSGQGNGIIKCNPEVLFWESPSKSRSHMKLPRDRKSRWLH